MNSVQSQLAAATVERDWIEAAVWARDVLLEKRRDMLPYLMTQQELLRWRAIEAAIVEMRKHL